MMLKHIGYLAIASTLALAVGCTRTISHGVDQNGQVNGLVFPEITQSKKDRAIHPNLENLLKMRQGMNKHDVYYLLGVPHYREMLGAREWDYLFKYEFENAEQFCQYKVLYDKHGRVGGMYWKPAECMGQMTMPSGR